MPEVRHGKGYWRDVNHTHPVVECLPFALSLSRSCKSGKLCSGRVVENNGEEELGEIGRLEHVHGVLARAETVCSEINDVVFFRLSRENVMSGRGRSGHWSLPSEMGVRNESAVISQVHLRY